MSATWLCLAALAAAPVTKLGPQPLDIHADHLTVLTQDHRGIWTGHVHAVRPATPTDPQLDLRCDRLVTDLAGDQKLQRVTCTGNVSVVQGDRLGWGDHAVYDAQTGQLVVTGHPRGQQGLNRFRGDSLTFFVNGDRIEVVHPVVDTPAPRALAKTVPPSARTASPSANAAPSSKAPPAGGKP